MMGCRSSMFIFMDPVRVNILLPYLKFQSFFCWKLKSLRGFLIWVSVDYLIAFLLMPSLVSVKFFVHFVCAFRINERTKFTASICIYLQIGISFVLQVNDSIEA